MGDLNEYFKKGSDVEISNSDSGFRGALYAGTVIRPASAKNKNKFFVEYKTLMVEDAAGKKPLRGTFDAVQLRPPPPWESHRSFKFSDVVDAYHNDGWWEGVVTEVLESERYSIFLRSTREQLELGRSDLRLHREWVRGKWIPPLEEDEEEEGEMGQNSTSNPCVHSNMSPRSKNFSNNRGKRQRGDESSSLLPKNPVMFKSLVHEQRWYHFEGKTVVSGRPVRLESVYDNYLKTHLCNFGWESLMHLPDKVYPQLVRLFYCNMIYLDQHDDYPQVQSYVKGVPITLNINVLHEILGLPMDGDHIFFVSEIQLSKFVPNEREYYESFTINRVGGGRVVAKDVKPKLRLLNKFITFNILPKGGHYHEVKPFQGFLLHCFATGRRLCLPFILMKVMNEALVFNQKGLVLPYGALLTKIFSHFRVNLDNEDFTKTSQAFDQGTLKRMLPLEDKDEALGGEMIEEGDLDLARDDEEIEYKVPDEAAQPEQVGYEVPVAISLLEQPSRASENEKHQFQSPCNDWYTQIDKILQGQKQLEEKFNQFTTSLNDKFTQLGVKIDGGFSRLDQLEAKIDSDFSQISGTLSSLASFMTQYPAPPAPAS